MGWLFKHTSRQRGMWRGWLHDGRSVEVYWRRYNDWSFGAAIIAVDCQDDDDVTIMNLHLTFWRFSLWLPLRRMPRKHEPMDGPRWGFEASQEFGLQVYWGQRRKSWDWPWAWRTLEYQVQLVDGSWVDVWYDPYGEKADVYRETHPYRYVLRSGTVQDRTATIEKRRHIITWVAFHRLGWPRWIKESIDIRFSDEVGERSGSWKGGCIGCGYDLLPGETMEQALRRMESERTF